MDGNVNALHSGNPINDQKANVPKRHSRFDLSSTLAQTMRFGEITPHFVSNTNPNEKFSVGSSHDLRTFTLKAPLMSRLSIKKDYFAVPFESILPNQWSRIYTNPNIGDDVPLDAYTSVNDFWKKVSVLCESLWSRISYYYASYVASPSSDSFQELISATHLYFCVAQYFYSNGSLLNYLGVNTVGRFTYLNTTREVSNVRLSFDQTFDEFYSLIRTSGKFSHSFNGVSYTITDNVRNQFCIHINDFLSRCRDNGYLDLNLSAYSSANVADIVDWIADFIDDDDNSVIHYFSPTSSDQPVDLARLFAYQIVCAHFYTNDKVDYIYSAELYRQNIKAAIEYADEHSVNGVGHNETISTDFEWNGTYLLYDYCSSHFFNCLVDPELFAPDDYFSVTKYLSLIFAFRNSLRFVDYFTGSKTRPLAVGSTDVSVNSQSGSVSVVDITRNIQIQRFLNAVNRTGRKFSNYVKSLFGNDVRYDYHDPMFLGHTSDDIISDETQNTGEALITDAQSIRSNLKSNSSRYAFEGDFDRSVILLGVTYFDIPRLYVKATERQTMVSDRFDMFNPMLEFIGDQPVFGDEVDPSFSSSPFGYQTRYMEYKQAVSRAVGGFVENLPGFAFLADSYEGVIESHISPSYIRSKPVELDEFYTSLTGLSMASYFHFIVVNKRNVDATRPMSYSPQIL